MSFSQYCTLFFLTAAVCVEYYFIYAYFVLSKMGKYPPFVPTKAKVAALIFDEIAAVLTGRQKCKIVEAGCGDARILASLAERFPDFEFIGYEWDFLALFLASCRCRALHNTRILRQDFMTADYSDTDVLILFLGNEIADAYSKKLERELPNGSIVVSECFEMPHLTCIKKIAARNNYFFLPADVFIYQIDRTGRA